MAKKFNAHFWTKLYEEWDRLHAQGATVKEFTDQVAKMLAEADSDPLPPPPVPPPIPPDDEP